MSAHLKKLLKWVIIILIIIGLGYVGFKVYHFTIDRISQKVGSEIVKEASKEIIGIAKPVKLPEKIFGK